MIIFIWTCIARANAVPTAEHRYIVEHHASHPLVLANLSLADRWSEGATGVVQMQFHSQSELSRAELVLEMDMSGGPTTGMIVWDSGAKRGVRRDLDSMIPGSTRTCPFQIRGIHSTLKQC